MQRDLQIVLIVTICTLITRATPFLLFGRNSKPPKIVNYLGEILPSAIMAILIVYCLKEVTFSLTSGFVPQFLSVALVVLLHLWKRNILLSIAGGTISYMLLVQFIFH